MLYASELFKDIPHIEKQLDKNDEASELPDIIAEILVYFVRE